MSILKKGMILAVAALFVSLSMAPVITAEKETKSMYAVNFTSVKENGRIIKDTLILNEEEVNVLKNRLSSLLELLKNQDESDDIMKLLLNFMNLDEYPILSRIISNLFNSELLMKGNLVFSEGWSMTLNPFNDGDISFMKPITLWRYQDASDMFQVPSMTAIIDLNPFELKTIEGSQFGFMFRFKGIYLEITQPLPQQSFTFFLGVSRHATAFELPSISLPEGLSN
jgi:hypothetical protein